ncbi:phage gateway protein [Azotobacter salinestris]|uniref:phage gateway protein n=1 Tax=Azotobacter salinestris TaxID=69964 RepID=UPI001266D0BD|nr:hypothetical protein [Azotobacter salinestris]
MTARELAILLRAQLIAGLARYGDTSTTVAQAYQQGQQGRMDAGLYFFTVTAHRHGWQARRHVYDPDADETVTEESQVIETTFQIFGLGPQAEDITHTAAMVCNSLFFVEGMRAGGAGVQRVGDVRNPIIQNDRGQFEGNPSFDLIVTTRQTRVDRRQAVERVEIRMGRV